MNSKKDNFNNEEDIYNEDDSKDERSEDVNRNEYEDYQTLSSNVIWINQKRDAMAQVIAWIINNIPFWCS